MRSTPAWSCLLSVVAISGLIILSFSLGLPALAQQSAPTQQSPRPLITSAIDESQRITLRGNVHPLARPEFDLGTAQASLPMERMLLVLKRSPEQETALRKMLDDQQDKASPNYRHWLTPEEFGQQFGPTDDDMQKITVWLQSHGFQVGTTKGRTVLEFSGSASQVQEAFHTAIHKYLVNGEQHWANAGDPQVPAALAPAVAGVASLHNFLKKPQYILSKETGVVSGKPPHVTFSDGSHGLGPADYAVIYNINPVYNAGITGNGVTIGVVARTEIQISDFQQFQNLLGFSSNVPTIVLNGADPGDVPGDDLEGTLDATWSQAVAPGASVQFVVSASTDTTDGVDLSELYIVENNLANVMTESYGSCEANAGDSYVSFVLQMAEQAAAQGITSMVSSGDNGAEGCDNPNAEAAATGPISVNVLASSPFTVAVGGTVFNEHGQDSNYWSSNNGAGAVSALSYIPENVWNDSCPSSTCGSNANIWAASGGASTGNLASGGTFPGYAKPSWQVGVTGIPSSNNRYLPDVSLTAAPHDGYVLCFQNSCAGQQIYRVAGTSASAPSFAGIMALVDQKMASVQPSSGARQGQADYVLYPLAAAANSNLSKCNGSSTTTAPASTCTFNDTTSGNNEVPGEPGYPSAPYTASTGYDGASGLGSVNVANLVNNWASAIFRATKATLTLSPTTNITHGQAVNVTVSVTPSSGTGTPTGDVALLATVGGVATGDPSAVDRFTLTSAGTFTGTTSQLPGGASYQVTAHYAGNSTSTSSGVFAASDSTPVTVTVTAENSTTTIAGTTLDANGNFTTLASGASIPYGDLVYLDATVAGASGNGLPTGSVSFSDTKAGGISGNFGLNSEGSAVTAQGMFNLPAGAHSVTATYIGDNSFKTSSSSAFPFTISKGVTALSLVASPTSIASGATTTLTATFTLGSAGLSSYGAAPTGTVSFYNGATLLASSPVSGTSGSGNILTGSTTAATATAALTTSAGALADGSDTITAVYTGDTNYAASPTSNGVNVTVGGTPDFTLPTGGFGTVNVSAPGGTGTVNLSLTATNGFTGTVTFTCVASSLPSETTCSTGTIAGPATTGTMSVTTTGPHQVAHLEKSKQDYLAFWTLAGGLTFGAVLLLGAPRRRVGVAMLLLVLGLIVMLPACGGGGGSGTHTDPGTPVGQTTVSVTATSGTLSHTATFVLNVQ